jgi:hypothetical protein
MFLIFRFNFFNFCFADYLIFLIIFSCFFVLAFLAHFPIRKEAIVHTLSICPSVTASSLQGVNQGVIYGLIESLWAKDLNYGEKITQTHSRFVKKRDLKYAPKHTKISTLETGRFTRSLILSFYCHVHFCYFFHTKVANLAFLLDFSPIGNFWCGVSLDP